jgi:putative nucleotidyltransferase with HDIG domain
MSDPVRDKAFEFVSDLGKGLDEGTLELPSFPDIALRVRRVLESPDVSIDQVARVVNSEPVLAARLLRTANSALMQRGGAQVNDLRTAILRLGYNMVRNAAMSLAMQQIFQARSLSGLKTELHALWRHSIRVAAISYVIATRLTKLNADEAFLAGLLHDIGKFYILTRAEFYPELFANKAVLRELMDQWHTGVGRAILDAWDFPGDFALAADEHDVLDREHLGPPDLTDVVLVANLHARLQEGMGTREDVNWDDISAFDRLKLTPETSVAVLQASAREIDSLTRALSGR